MRFCTLLGDIVYVNVARGCPIKYATIKAKVTQCGLVTCAVTVLASSNPTLINIGEEVTVNYDDCLFSFGELITTFVMPKDKGRCLENVRR